MENTGKHPGGRPRKATTTDKITAPGNNRYFTVDEAAAILGLHRHTVQARLRDGTIRGKKIGGVWRIYRDALQGSQGTP